MAARASEMLGRGGLLRQAAAATAGALCGRRGFCSPPLGNSACARLPLSTTAQGQSGEGFCLGASVSPSASAGHLLLRTSRPRFGSLEDYYVMGEVATCIQSPMKYYGWFAWGFLMVFVSVGSLLHSNYYFSGRMLPKPSGNTQLLDDEEQ